MATNQTPAPRRPFLRAAGLSLAIAAAVAFLAGALITANTMGFVAETAGFCEDGRVEEWSGAPSGPRNTRGETVYCVKGKKRRDIGTQTLFLGWGVYGTAVGFVLWPSLFAFIYVLIRKRSSS